MCVDWDVLDHDENICDILKTVDKSYHHIKRYQSQHKNTILNEVARKNKCSYRTMGRPETAPPDPHGFLRRGAGVGGGNYSRMPPVNEEGRKPKCLLGVDGKRAPLPSRERSKSCSPRKKGTRICENCFTEFEKNWKSHNIRKVVKAKPNIPPARFVDGSKGDTFELENSGLIPKYIYKKNYGKTPKYIKKFQKERENAEKKRFLEEEEEKLKELKSGFVSQEEREELLHGLKHNRVELLKQFNKLPLLVDTISKANQKTMLEIQLRTLEKDILSLEENKYIYVYDDHHHNHNHCHCGCH